MTIPLLMYIAIMMPFRLCFGVEAKSMGTMWLWELSIDFMFIADIMLNFRTGACVRSVDRSRPLMDKAGLGLGEVVANPHPVNATDRTLTHPPPPFLLLRFR